MASTTTLRPSSTTSGVGWTPSTGTLHGVTSDDSDATYASWSGSGSALILATPADAPPAGERRHQVRVRARGEDGNAWWSVRAASGALVAGASAQFPSSPATVTGSWGFGVPPDGSTVLSCYVTGQSAGLKIEELYLDVDCRDAPTFIPQILDGAGLSTTTVTDTAQPTVHASSIDLDGLAAQSYRYWVTSGATIVWDTGVTAGPAADRQTTALDNGSYTLHAQIWSTIGQSAANPSDEETLAFTVQVDLLGAPDNPAVSQIATTPFYEVEACMPYVDDLDGGVGYLEIQRVDCNDVTTSIAMLGPLETGECDSWQDFTLPRSGVAITCDHHPDPCCSYYRARTVGRLDGTLRISNWSDFFSDNVPPGVMVMWPDTAASIPSGWSRVTALDGKYTKGIATNATDPGATGGAATHTHTITGHTHDTTHAHTVTGATGNAGAGQVSTPGTAGTMGALTSHTHTRSAVNSGTVVSGSTSPGIGTAANDPARLDVIFVQSNGSADGVPDGALAMTADISLSGWTDYANAASRFFKGAATAGNGGATTASQTAAHSHSVAAHTHTGTSHTHTSPNTGAFASDRTFNAGTNPGLWTTTHAHTVTVGAASTASLASGGSGSSGTASPDEPPYRNVRVKENTSGVPDLPVGLICGWRGPLARIPDFWQLCNGTNGTLDMSARHPKGATASIGSTGGSLNSHTHTSPSHNHTTSGHTHTETVNSAATATTNISTTSAQTDSLGTHTHTAGDTDSTTPTVASVSSGTLAAATTEPPYEEVAFIQLMSTPTPPPDPETFCLTWDDGEHLIRSLGPDGPLWSPVLGKFEWSVDRPFTAASGVSGSRFVTSAPPGGRNLSMTAAVESEEDLAQLRAVLARPLVLVSPSDASEVWAAPVAESVRVVKVGRIRQVTAQFIGTGPQPEPQLADVGS